MSTGDWGRETIINSVFINYYWWCHRPFDPRATAKASPGDDLIWIMLVGTMPKFDTTAQVSEGMYFTCASRSSIVTRYLMTWR